MFKASSPHDLSSNNTEIASCPQDPCNDNTDNTEDTGNSHLLNPLLIYYLLIHQHYQAVIL